MCPTQCGPTFHTGLWLPICLWHSIALKVPWEQERGLLCSLLDAQHQRRYWTCSRCSLSVEWTCEDIFSVNKTHFYGVMYNFPENLRWERGFLEPFHPTRSSPLFWIFSVPGGLLGSSTSSSCGLHEGLLLNPHLTFGKALRLRLWRWMTAHLLTVWLRAKIPYPHW